MFHHASINYINR